MSASSSAEATRAQQRHSGWYQRAQQREAAISVEYAGHLAGISDQFGVAAGGSRLDQSSQVGAVPCKRLASCTAARIAPCSSCIVSFCMTAVAPTSSMVSRYSFALTDNPRMAMRGKWSLM